MALALCLAGNRHGIGWLEEPDAEHVELAKNLPTVSLGQAWDALLRPSRYPHLLTLVLAPVLAMSGDADPYWIGRAVAGVLGALAVAYVFLLGREVRGPRTGLLAATWFATSPLVVLNGHLVKPHLPVVLFTTAALHHCARACTMPGRRHLFAAAAFGAAAAATVHSGFLVAAPLFVTLLARPAADPKRSPRRLFRADAWAALGLLLLAIPIGFPGRIPVLGRVLFDGADPQTLLEPHAPVASVGIAGLLRVPVQLFEFDPAATLLGLLALVLGAITRPAWWRACVPGIALFIAFLAVLGHDETFAIRFFLPVMPVLAVAGAALVDGACARIGRGSVAFTIAAIVLVLPGAATSARVAWLHRQEDTREAAARWIESNVAPGTSIVAHPYLDFPLHLDARSLSEHEAAVGALTQFDRRQRRELARGVTAKRYDVHFPFTGDRVRAPAAFLAALTASRARFALSIFPSGVALADPAFDVYRPLGESVHVEAPGRPGRAGGEMYLMRWPILQSWFLSRPGPLVEITALEEKPR